MMAREPKRNRFFKSILKNIIRASIYSKLRNKKPAYLEQKLNGS